MILRALWNSVYPAFLLSIHLVVQMWPMIGVFGCQQLLMGDKLFHHHLLFVLRWKSFVIKNYTWSIKIETNSPIWPFLLKNFTSWLFLLVLPGLILKLIYEFPILHHLIEQYGYLACKQILLVKIIFLRHQDHIMFEVTNHRFHLMSHGPIVPNFWLNHIVHPLVCQMGKSRIISGEYHSPVGWVKSSWPWYFLGFFHVRVYSCHLTQCSYIGQSGQCLM